MKFYFNIILKFHENLFQYFPKLHNNGAHLIHPLDLGPSAKSKPINTWKV